MLQQTVSQPTRLILHHLLSQNLATDRADHLDYPACSELAPLALGPVSDDALGKPDTVPTEV